MDFTPATYTRLLETLQASGYSFQTIAGFFESAEYKTVLLRHDVDLLPRNALAMAKLENGMGIVATYYFRAVPESWDEGVIREIASLGHELGYHYECLATASKKMRGLEGERVSGAGRKKIRGLEVEKISGKQDQRERLYELAYEDFKRNLERLRKLAPVKTVCMHGSPLSGIDNLHLLRTYDYKSLGLVAEPYLDVNFDEVFYLTDTGRRWDGDSVSVRDKVKAQSSKLKGKRWPRFHSTFDVIAAIEAGRFPGKVMMTVHPQRWTDKPWPWVRELVAQNVKNIIKGWMIRMIAFGRDDSFREG